MPAVTLLALGTFAFVVNGHLPHASRQAETYGAGVLILLMAAGLLLWLLLFSGMRWRSRVLVLLGALCALGVFFSLFIVRGVTGDLVPILEWRWNKKLIEEVSTAAAAQPPPVPPGASDWPQFLGPHRDTSVAGPELDPDWGKNPPRILWRRPVGTAWSGFAVSGGVAVTQEQRGDQECTVAYRLIDGQPLWLHAVEARYFTTLAGEGPRATPAISGGRVFSQGATGHLAALSLQDGSLIWERWLIPPGEALPDWGVSASPLLEGDSVVAAAGTSASGRLHRLDGATGQVQWSSQVVGETYSSPVAAGFEGTRQILFFGSDGLEAHRATDGERLWSHPWKRGHPHVAAPLRVEPSGVIISSGYGTGAARVDVRQEAGGGWVAEEAWRTNKLRAKFASLSEAGGHLYGLDDGTMACLDAVTGERRWKEGDYGHGQQILAGTLLLLMAESGEVVLIRPDPTGLQELARLKLFEHKTWNPPALAGRYLLVRNDREAACLELPVVPAR